MFFGWAGVAMPPNNYQYNKKSTPQDNLLWPSTIAAEEEEEDVSVEDNDNITTYTGNKLFVDK